MDKSTGRLKAVAAYAKSVGIAADQLINAVLGGRLKPCPSAPTASACWMAGEVGGVWFGSSINCFGGKKPLPGAYAAAVNRCTYKNKSPADVWQGGIHKR